jgi:transcription elongation factor GreA
MGATITRFAISTSPIRNGSLRSIVVGVVSVADTLQVYGGFAAGSSTLRLRARPPGGLRPCNELRGSAPAWRPKVEKDVILTPEGFEKLQKELETLTTVSRRDVADRIREAREFGDISENSEYDDAKNEQAMLEKQIAELEDKLRSASVIDEKAVSTDVVSVGSIVHVKDQKTDKSVKYKIVGSAEANPSEMKLSNESPVGKALLGRKRGEVVSVPVPRGPQRKLKITKIER